MRRYARVIDVAFPNYTRRGELKKIVQESLRVARTEGARVLVGYVLEKLARREFRIIDEILGSISYLDKTALVASNAAIIDSNGYVRFEASTPRETRQERVRADILLVSDSISFEIDQALERLRCQDGVTIGDIIMVNDNQSHSVSHFARRHGLLLKNKSQMSHLIRPKAKPSKYFFYIKGGAIPASRKLLVETVQILERRPDIDAIVVRQLPRSDTDEMYCQLNWNRYRMIRGTAMRLDEGIVIYDGRAQGICPLEEPCICFRRSALKPCLPVLARKVFFANDLASAGLRVAYMLTAGVIYSLNWSPSSYLRNGFVNWKNRIEQADYKFPEGLAKIDSLDDLLRNCLEMYRKLTSGIDAIIPLSKYQVLEVMATSRTVMLGVRSNEGKSQCQDLRELLERLSKVTRGRPQGIHGVPKYLALRWAKDIDDFGRWLDATGQGLEDDRFVDTLFKILAFEIGRAMAEYEAYDKRNHRECEALNTILASDAI